MRFNIEQLDLKLEEIIERHIGTQWRCNICQRISFKESSSPFSRDPENLKSDPNHISPNEKKFSNLKIRRG